jgi:hypothetical protein
MRQPAEDVARLLRAAGWGRPVAVVTDRVGAVMTRSAMEFERIAGERGMVAT